jgi:hypothetical protein
MRCITCGERMRLVERVPDDTMFVSGYEHHMSECLGCGETERRLVFRRSDEPSLQEELRTPDCDEAPSAAPLVPAEPQPDGLALRAVGPEKPQRLARSQRLSEPQGAVPTMDIDSLRARLDNLRQRAELSDKKTRAAKREEEERRRFVDFWDGLLPSKLSAQS